MLIVDGKIYLDWLRERDRLMENNKFTRILTIIWQVHLIITSVRAVKRLNYCRCGDKALFSCIQLSSSDSPVNIQMGSNGPIRRFPINFIAFIGVTHWFPHALTIFDCLRTLKSFYFGPATPPLPPPWPIPLPPRQPSVLARQ